MKFLAARRRSPLFAPSLLAIALVAVGGAYAAISSAQTAQAADAGQVAIDEGNKLYLTGCSSCHGMQAEGSANGPTLIGVGAASVHFQVATGRMPLAAPGAQAVAKEPQYSADETAQLAAYVASLAPGPAIPTAEQLDYEDADIAEGGVLFRVNCAQCHQAAGQGGALTYGKYAPSLMEATPQQMYEAMVSGPQSMPVFSNGTLPVEEKKAIIAYVSELQVAPNPGGLSLGRVGPVTEGLFLWTAVFAALIGAAVWIGIKAR
ncbi:MAG: c-type cytochrome [Actinobacteria bacterium]|uniref:Cytochrome bc1 complex cytochrome c subunit n=1 Tax=freshwater metagenome TaxID=449393 RepID=A0A6J7JMJ7_9ZZZZ|nr:c-type cytochrome [Actinomycetota bacterium]